MLARGSCQLSGLADFMICSALQAASSLSPFTVSHQSVRLLHCLTRPSHRIAEDETSLSGVALRMFLSRFESSRIKDDAKKAASYTANYTASYPSGGSHGATDTIIGVWR